jgi:hypothetical protein
VCRVGLSRLPEPRSRDLSEQGNGASSKLRTTNPPVSFYSQGIIMDAAKLVQTYVKIRDARDTLVRAHEEQLKTLQDQLDLIEQEILTICKETGQDGGKTPFGSFSRTIKTRYWTNDWDSMYQSFVQ